MWTRSLLKQNAKLALGGRYWQCLLVCLVLGLLGVRAPLGSDIRLSFNLAAISDGAFQYDAFGVDNFGHPLLGIFLMSAAVIIIVMWGLALCWSAFLGGPLRVGIARYYMENRESPTPFGTAFSVFESGYLNTVKVMLLTELKIIGGTLLLVIPGIYWRYCYFMVPYLLAENPYMTTRRAMELSKQMMQGEKWKTFVLGLSFIGWELLAALTCGIGGLFLAPYIQATCAELYAALRSKAFAYGLTDETELAGFVVHDQPQ